MDERIEEVIMEYHTNGVDQWALKRKSKIVRCKDCDYWDADLRECLVTTSTAVANHFCGYGKKSGE